jgi:hypothetical protein
VPVDKSVRGPNLDHAWVISDWPSDKLGHPVRPSLGILESCSHAVTNNARLIDPSCLARHGAGFIHTLYQPASRFWLFQGIETALFGGAAVALILFAAWWVHDRAS